MPTAAEKKAAAAEAEAAEAAAEPEYTAAKSFGYRAKQYETGAVLDAETARHVGHLMPDRVTPNPNTEEG